MTRADRHQAEIMVRLQIGEFVGVENYARLFANPGFIDTIWRTVYFGLLISVAATVFGFLIALLLDQQFAGRTVLRVVVVLPWAVPPVVAGVLWGQMFHADVGFVNALLYRVGLIDQYQIWLGDGWTALHVIAIAEIWKAIPFMAPRETGRWFVQGDQLCQQFPTWYDGQVSCFTLRRTGETTLRWRRDDGYSGRARIEG